MPSTKVVIQKLAPQVWYPGFFNKTMTNVSEKFDKAMDEVTEAWDR